MIKISKKNKVATLKTELFDLVRKLEIIQSAITEIVKIKQDKLKELHNLELKLGNRYARAKQIINK